MWRLVDVAFVQASGCGLCGDWWVCLVWRLVGVAYVVWLGFWCSSLISWRGEGKGGCTQTPKWNIQQFPHPDYSSAAGVACNHFTQYSRQFSLALPAYQYRHYTKQQCTWILYRQCGFTSGGQESVSVFSAAMCKIQASKCYQVLTISTGR